MFSSSAIAALPPAPKMAASCAWHRQQYRHDGRQVVLRLTAQEPYLQQVCAVDAL
jgi:hypothetical protein